MTLLLDALQADRLSSDELAHLTGLPSVRLTSVLDSMLTGGLLQCLPNDTYARRQVRC